MDTSAEAKGIVPLAAASALLGTANSAESASIAEAGATAMAAAVKLAPIETRIAFARACYFTSIDKSVEDKPGCGTRLSVYRS
jgi:hypothetical protein